jgi:hypothetical protein
MHSRSDPKKIFFIVLLVLVGTVLLPRHTTHAALSNRYATSCVAGASGTWNNMTNAQGAPDLSSSAAYSSFTTGNSGNDIISEADDMECSGFANTDLGTFNSAKIFISLATDGAGGGNDYLDINYQVGATTYDLVDITQDSQKSNATNSGYWEYSAPNITSWTDVGNTTLHFEGVKVGKGDGYTAYVDAVWVEVDYTPTGGGGPTYTQNDFEWFATANSVTLTNIWPSGDGENLSENDVITQFPPSNEPLAPGDQIRLQMNMTVGSATLSASTQAFKLQYSEDDDCTTASVWLDVGGKGSGTIWRLFDEAAIGDSTTQVNDISTSTASAEGYYSEINPSAVNPNEVLSGENTEWDWPLENNGANENSTYCFRMVLSDGTELDSYNTDSYPKMVTAPGAVNLMRHGNVFESEVEKGYFWTN